MDVEEARNEIERKYREINRKIHSQNFFGTVLGISVMLSGIIFSYFYNKNNHFNETKIKYDSAVSTLGILKNEREKPIPDLPYTPENVKPYLEDIIEREKKNGSLEKAIELVEKDVEDIRESREYSAYNKGLNLRDVIAYSSLAIGGLGAMGLIMLNTHRAISNLNRRGKEIESLREGR